MRRNNLIAWHKHGLLINLFGFQHRRGSYRVGDPILFMFGIGDPSDYLYLKIGSWTFNLKDFLLGPWTETQEILDPTPITVTTSDGTYVMCRARTVNVRKRRGTRRVLTDGYLISEYPLSLTHFSPMVVRGAHPSEAIGNALWINTLLTDLDRGMDRDAEDRRTQDVS